ncbi:polysaccharide deacetylase [Candidatus Saccharibacteria bacterium]|nr:polysaccharide deacetylase [Candidatus Saccharibacteria bacterium]
MTNRFAIWVDGVDEWGGEWYNWSMKVRRRHRYLLMGLTGVFGVMMFAVVGVFLASDIIRSSWPEIVSGTCIYYDEEEHLEREKAKLAEAKGVIYLTFDDGPGPYTAELLDVLKQYGVKATFFVTGAGDDALIAREYKEGHAVGLHTFSHNYAYIYSGVDNFLADLAQVGERVKNITGSESKLMRFPGGSSNTVSRRYDGRTRIMSKLAAEVEAQGYAYFDWNVDSGDAGGAKTTDAVVARVTSGLKEGPNVVLQHDVKDFSVAAVEDIIKYGLSNGFLFAALDTGSFNAHHGINN